VISVGGQVEPVEMVEAQWAVSEVPVSIKCKKIPWLKDLGDGILLELVDSYLEMETVHPNFGDSRYVTGLQPNVRPQRLVLIFERPIDVRDSYWN